MNVNDDRSTLELLLDEIDHLHADAQRLLDSDSQYPTFVAYQQGRLDALTELRDACGVGVR